MAYDELLARRIEARLGARPGLLAKKMFGGVGYMLHGNMACGVLDDNLIVRVGVENYAAALSRPHVRVFDSHTRRPMRGWVMVGPQGVPSQAELDDWIAQGVAAAEALPPK